MVIYKSLRKLIGSIKILRNGIVLFSFKEKNWIFVYECRVRLEISDSSIIRTKEAFHSNIQQYKHTHSWC